MKKLKALDVSKDWIDYFEEVNKKTFLKYMRKYIKKYDCGCISDDVFDIIVEQYCDYGLKTGKYKNGTPEVTNECTIALKYLYDDETIDYYLRKDR